MELTEEITLKLWQVADLQQVSIRNYCNIAYTCVLSKHNEIDKYAAPKEE